MANVIVLDLPFPPSANRMWRHARGTKPYRSSEYMNWTDDADFLVIGKYPKKKITGAFSAFLTFDKSGIGYIRRGDLDNLIKPVLDWLQSRDIIRNDKDCCMVMAQWGVAKHGCHVELAELDNEV